MSEKIKSVRIEKLLAHPDNPNVMSDSKLKKLVRNIERTGLYEPIVVRPHPKEKDHFEIINGHHRLKALRQLKYKKADCVVWNVDDAQTAILLTTLNRLAGSDVPSRKIGLLTKLSGQISPPQLAKLLPQTAKQIERLTNLKLFAIRYLPSAESFAVPLVFFVTRQQKEIIENALSSIENPVSSIEKSNANRRAAALTEIASRFIEDEKCGM
jgi:hypothetical protein